MPQPPDLPGVDWTGLTGPSTTAPPQKKTFYDAQSAKSDAAPVDFFAIEGVAGLFIINEFCTVYKTPTVPWENSIPKIESAIRARWGN